MVGGQRESCAELLQADSREMRLFDLGLVELDPSRKV